MEVYRRSSWLLLLLGLSLLATALQGVQGEVESEGPTESECRPYIEKALKELETGDTENAAPPEDGDSKEDLPTVEITTDDSDHLQGDGDDDDDGDGKDSTESAEIDKTDDVVATEGDGDDNDDDDDDDDNDDDDHHDADIKQDDDHEDDDESGEQNKSTEDTSQEEGASEEHVAGEGDQEESKENENKSEEDEKENEVVQNDEPADATDSAEDATASKEDDAENKEDDSKEEEGGSKEEDDKADSKEDDGVASKEEEGGSKEEDDKADSKEDDGVASKEEEAADESKENDDDADSKEGDASNEETEAEPEVEASKEDGVEASKEEEEGEDSKEHDAVASKEDDDADSKEDEQKESKEDDGEGSTEADDKDSKEDDDKNSKEDQDDSKEDDAADSKADDDSKEEVKVDAGDEDSKEEEKEDSKEDEAGAASKEDDGDSKEDSKETESKEKDDDDDDGDDNDDDNDEAAAEVEELLKESEEDLSELRPRDHIAQLLKLDQESSDGEQVADKMSEIILRDLKKLYENAIKPLETLYKYRDLSNRHFGDAEIFSKPLILFMGPWSGGKSSIINYLVDIEHNETSLHTGAEPSPAYFNILMYGDEPEVLDGTELAADYTFSGLQKFGQGLEERLRGYKLPSKLLEKVNIVEIPGILEVRKQVSRIFPFNDACQWFIDRADIIFLIYDPSKLDVGPETEAILDQLKGREQQTRIVLNKADQVKPEELMRVQGALIWNISPLMSSAQPPIMYTTSLWSKPYEPWAPVRLLQAQERAFLRDLRSAVDKRIDNKIASARRFAVRVRNHAKMVDCYLTTYYNHKSVFGNRKQISDEIINHPQDYHIYEGLSTLTNISRYDLPDPDVYRDFFRLNALYDFQQLSATCTYFRGCPINRLDVAIAYDLPELVGKHKRLVETASNEASTAPTPGS